MTVSRAIGLKLFLEGQEIDVASADLSCGVNQQANCSIEIPTSDSVHKLLPRTLVHLFYFDTSHSTPFIAKYPDDVVGAADGSKVKGVDRSRDIKTKADGSDGLFHTIKGADGLLTHSDMKKDFRYWKLLFVGEVLGYRYRNTTSGRSIILSCVDCSSYWSSAQLYWGGAKLSSSTYKRAIFVGAAQVHRGKSKVDSSGDLLKVLKRKPSSVNQIHGLLGGCISLLESASGVYGVGEYKKYRGVNDFMTVAELRLKLTRMIAAAPNDTTSEVFIKQKSFARYLRKLTRGLKATSSYMDLLGTLLSKCYYNYSSVLAPPYFPDGVHEVWGDVKEPPKNDSPAPAGAKGRAKSGRAIMKQMSEAIWDTWTKCGLAVEKVNNTKDSKAGPTGKDWVAFKGNTELKNKLVTKLKGLINKAKSVGLHTEAGLVAARNEASKNATTDAKRKTASTLSIGFNYWYNAYQAAVELSQRPVDQHSEYLYRQVVKKIRWAIGKLGRGLGVYGTVVREKVTLRQTLHCFMFMPDIYMCPPPKCNVLFPNQVSSIEFDRSYLSEVTRLALHGRKASGRNLKTLYFAPNGDVLGDKESTKTLYQDALSAAKKSHSFLMKHEKYIGIIPSIMGLGDNEAHEKINAATEKQLKKLGKDDATSPFQAGNAPSLSGAASSGKKQHMARAANYMFYSSRYDGRTMRLNCRFSPQLVPGQPCLVLDPNKNARSIVSVDADIKQVIELEREMAKMKSALLGLNTYRLPPAETGIVDSVDELLESDSSYQDLAAKLASAKNGVNSRLAKGKTKGTHYLGLIAGINHAFHASGGASTTVILSKARTHTEGVDIFGEPEDAGPRASAKQTVRHRAKYTYGANQSAGWWVECTKGPGKVEKNDAGEFVNTYHPMRKPSKLYEDKHGSYGPPSKGHWKIRTAKSTYKEGDPGLGTIKGLYFAKVTVLKKGKLKEASRTSSTLGAKFSFEQTATPPWFSHIYHPDLIGENFYAVLNGCMSVLDGNLLRGVEDFEHLGSLEDSVKEAISYGEDLGGDRNMDHSKQIISDFSETKHYVTLFGKGPTGKKILEKTLSDVKYTLPGPNDGEPINIPSSISTQQQTVFQAAEALTEIYLMMEENNLDTDRWVESYTNRRFATMADIFGVPATTASVKIGNKSGDYRKGTTKNEYHLRLRSSMALETMIDPNGKKYGEDDKGGFNSGFHTFAFGRVDPGTNLPGWEPLPMAGKPSKVKLRVPDKFVDPRLTRWDRVHTYSEEIHMISTSKPEGDER